jgi:hypothetical protein
MIDEECDDENCPSCGAPVWFVSVVNHLVDSVVTTTLTINQQMDQLDNVYNTINPNVGKYLSDNVENIMTKGQIDPEMRKLALFVQNEVESVIGHQV